MKSKLAALATLATLTPLVAGWTPADQGREALVQAVTRDKQELDKRDSEIAKLKAKNRRLNRIAYRAKLAYFGARRTLLHSGNVSEAISLACATYGNCSTLWRKARCESHLTATAHNPSGASGLFQFLGSTFRSTPYGSLSVWSPYANAMAAGWMHVHGRGGEWSCR